MAEEDLPRSHAEPHEGEMEAVRLRGQGHEAIKHEPGAESETALIKCGTTKGNFVARLHRDWSPNGYDRAKALFHRGYYDGSHFFRVVPKFLVQFGISYTKDRALTQFANTPIPDDPQLDPPKVFHRGTMSYAGSGPNSRTSQLFISYGDNPGFGKELWETPFGEVIEGMDNVAQLYSYGDMPPWGNGPVQNKIRQDPNYIPNEFPLLDKFTECTVEVETPDKPEEEVEEDGEGEGEELEAVKEAATDDAKERNTNAMGRAQALKGRAQALKGRAEAKLKGAVADLKSKSWSDVVNMEINEMMLLGALLSGMIVLVLVVVSTKRKKKKKKHKQ